MNHIFFLFNKQPGMHRRQFLFPMCSVEKWKLDFSEDVLYTEMFFRIIYILTVTLDENLALYFQLREKKVYSDVLQQYHTLKFPG